MYLTSVVRPAAAAAIGTLKARGGYSLRACVTGVELPRFWDTQRAISNSATCAAFAVRVDNKTRSRTPSSFLASRSMSTDEKGVDSSSGSAKEIKTAQDVIDFWFGDKEQYPTEKDYGEAMYGKWFGMGPPDQVFIDTQIGTKDLLRKAVRDELTGDEWEGPHGMLAKILLLDQFPRTAFRGSAEAFAGDEKAAQLALDVISKGWDKAGDHFTFHQRQFVYLPLMHSEQKETQEKSVEKATQLRDDQLAAGGGVPPGSVEFAETHRDVVVKFGRFPHRNAPLGRESTTEEKEWLASDDVPGWAKSQSAPADS